MVRIWKNIPGYPGYQASSDGLIRSVDRDVVHQQYGKTCVKRRKGRILKQWTPNYEGRANYARVTVNNDKVIGVHILVCIAFHGPKPADRPFALHKDDDKANNRQRNLYWGTAQDNYLDRRTNGTHNQGVPEHIKRQIRIAFVNGVGRRELTEIYGYDRSTIYRLTSKGSRR